MAEILLIDDDAQMRRVVARILREAGHSVHEAANGTEGLALFRRVRSDLVVSDIVMPETEGIELIRTLRQEAPALPILAVSGSPTALYLQAATKLGASAALRKPFAADKLLAMVNTLLAAAGV